MIIGLTCWQRCGATFEFKIPKSMHRKKADLLMEQAAGEVGWVIGHFDGQGQYACPDHKNTVWDPISLAKK
jgi:hypothetical protein